MWLLGWEKLLGTFVENWLDGPIELVSLLSAASSSMDSPAGAYCYPQLIQAIQQPQPDYDAAMHAVRTAQALVQDTQRALVQAEQQLAQAEAHLQQTIPAQQEHWQLIRELQVTQRACWKRTLTAELSGLILGKTSRYNTRMVAVSCPLLRDTTNAAEPIMFEASPWSRVRIAAGGCHTVCVSASGRVFAWGSNAWGQLGAGDTENRVVPTLITGGLLETKSVVQVTAGFRHTACLTADGLVLVCGYGGSGQLGGGDTETRVAPTLLRGELQGRKVQQVSAGANYTMCVTSNGLVFAWGYNSEGQLGVGDRDNRLVPTLLRGQLQSKSVVHVAAGCVHTMCMTTNGLLFACGSSGEGQLGIGDTEEDMLVPTLVTGQLHHKTAVCVAAGDHHTLCATVDGSLFAWGSNDRCQLGVDEPEGRWVPTLVTGLQGKQVVHVAAGSQHTICSTADGSVFTWGAGVDGELGLGDKYDMELPTLVIGELQNKSVVQVAAGERHSACVSGDGLLFTWGNHAMGQLGVGDAPIPSHLADLPVLVQALDINA